MEHAISSAMHRVMGEKCKRKEKNRKTKKEWSLSLWLSFGVLY